MSLMTRVFGRRIPRIIHYCWVGGAPPSREMQECIASWRNLHPAFDVMRWDESNLPEDPFITRAMEGGHWSRASNAVRLHALYAHGGFYLDTDVQVLRSLEPLRRYECVLGFQYVPDGTRYKPFEMCVASGVLGARPRHPYVQQLLAEIPRAVEGPEAFEILGPQMATAVLMRAGLAGYSETPVTVAGATILPKEAFYPYFYKEEFRPDMITRDTFSIHHWAKRW